jgi:hypothetical protein
MQSTLRGAVLAAAVLGLPAAALANNIAPFQTVFSTDYVVAGYGGLRNTGSGTLTISGVSGSINKAYLYWHGPTSTVDPTANANINFAGTPIMGTNIGFSSDNCWLFANSQGYRADVTSLVTGDGAYAISGLGTSPPGSGANTNGASLIVFFNDGVSSNNRDVVVFDGNDSNIANPYDANGWNVTLAGINYTSGTGALQLHVADGQIFPDDAIILNGSTLVPAGAVFDGNTVPAANNGPQNDGSLWDIRSFDITSYLNPGPNTFVMTTGENQDCLALVVAMVDLPAGAAPNQTITLAPATATNCTGDNHTVAATLVDDTGAPVTGKAVIFSVTSGPNSGVTSVATTNAEGKASFNYTSVLAGTDNIEACFVDDNGVTQCANAKKTWTVCNEPPDTGGATPTISCLWPPNHQFVDVGIVGVTDPDGDPVTIVVTGVTSDEPTATAKGAGGMKHAPDAKGVGTSTASLRPERSGKADGRVYTIHFIADDGQGGRTPGQVQVAVPHDRRRGTCNAVDSGQLYDATR